MKLIKHILVVLVIILTSVTTKAQFAITTAGTSYTWDFNSLPTANTPWANNSTIPNFYAAVTTTYTITTLNVSNGGATTGALYNFGATGDADRSLGSLGANATGNFGYSLRIVNNTGAALSALNISYKGEQWRTNNTAAQKLQFFYKISSSPVTTFDATTAGFTAVTSMDFTSPVLTTAGAVDGNVNSSTLTGTISAAIANGDEIILKWIDLNDAGNDHGMSIDDISIIGVASGAPSASLSASASSASETAATTVTITATLPATLSTNESVVLSVNGTGVSAGDYNLSNTTISIPAGSISASETISIINDLLNEGTETYTVQIASTSSGIIPGSPSSVAITVTDDDEQIALNTLNVANSTIDFNNIASAGTSLSDFSLGFYLYEQGGGTNDDEKYRADDGNLNTGDSYSYGSTASSDRAFGSLNSSSVKPIEFGFKLQNNTGTPINAVNINYYGEKWRNGSNNDTLKFEVSTDATALNNGTWSPVNALRFVTTPTTSNSAADGNLALNRENLVADAIFATVANGNSFWIKWMDDDEVGSDNGMAIDDIILTPKFITPNPEMDVLQASSAIANGSTFNFGQVLNGSTLDKVFVIQNNGLTALTISTHTFSGAGFSLIGSMPTSVAPVASSSFTIRFSPNSVASFTGSISIDNDDSDEDPYQINFEGEGVPASPEIGIKQNTTDYLNNSTYSFGNVVNGSSVQIVFAIHNTGTGVLTLSGNTITGAEYSLVGAFPTTVAVGATATFTVQFSPSATGTYTGDISIASDDLDENPYIINFEGIGEAPYAEANIKQSGTSYASGTTFNYGTRAISSNTDITFTIENSGNSNLIISTYTITGAEFSLQGTMPTTISAGATANFTIRFVPTAATTFSGNISLTNNDGDENPYVINFTGTGIVAQPEINVKESGINYFTGTTYDFANRTVGTNTDITFTIENNDSGTLLINTYTLTGTAYSVVGVIPASINGNSTANFTLRFAPAAAIGYSGTLTLSNNDVNESTYVINLTGNGVAIPANPSLKINEIMANPTAGSDWFELYNPGSTAVNLSGLYVSNSSLIKYKFPNGSPSVAAGGFIQVNANNGVLIAPLEANFTISNTDEIFLYGYDGATIIDQMAITNAVSGQSYGRKTDGDTELVSFSTATPAATNSAGVIVVSVNELNSETSLVIAPNPSSSVFTITYSNLSNDKSFTYRVIDITGKEVLSNKTNAVSGLNIYPVDVTSIAKGMYFVECTVGDKKVTNKIILE